MEGQGLFSGLTTGQIVKIVLTGVVLALVFVYAIVPGANFVFVQAAQTLP